MAETRYIVIEGPIGAGKTALAEKLAETLQARLVLEETQANPFLEEFQKDRRKYAFQTQLFFLLSRYRQLQAVSQLDLFHRTTVGDFLFERDRLFAELNLDDHEFELYFQVFHLLFERTPRPDLVVYLSAGSEILWERIQAKDRAETRLSYDYIKELNEIYTKFFYRYDRTPLLVVNTSHVDFIASDEDFRHLVKEIKNHRKGVKHYIPLGGGPGGLGPIG